MSLEIGEMAEEEDDHVDGEPVHEVAEAPIDGPRLRVSVDGVHEEGVDVILEKTMTTKLSTGSKLIPWRDLRQYLPIFAKMAYPSWQHYRGKSERHSGN